MQAPTLKELAITAVIENNLNLDKLTKDLIIEIFNTFDFNVLKAACQKNPKLGLIVLDHPEIYEKLGKFDIEKDWQRINLSFLYEYNNSEKERQHHTANDLCNFLFIDKIIYKKALTIPNVMDRLSPGHKILLENWANGAERGYTLIRFGK